MKLVSLYPFALQLLAAVPTLACLTVKGTIDTDFDMIDYAQVYDNGLLVCNNAWGTWTDQDNHYALSCLPGYVYATTKDGGFAWYRNNAGNAYSFYQTHSLGPATWYFDTKQFGC